LWVSEEPFLPSEDYGVLCRPLNIVFIPEARLTFYSATCAYLAAGKAKELRGMYIDCRQDVQRLQAAGREKLQQDGLYTLTMKFLEGYNNEP
jgi:hypothetical protein